MFRKTMEKFKANLVSGKSESNDEILKSAGLNGRKGNGSNATKGMVMILRNIPRNLGDDIVGAMSSRTDVQQ